VKEIDKQTDRCIRCLKRKGEAQTGHVLRYGEKVIASWCMKCLHTAGFVGHWKKEMGLRAWEID